MNRMAEQIFPEPTVGVFIFNQADELLLLRSHKWPDLNDEAEEHV